MLRALVQAEPLQEPARVNVLRLVPFPTQRAAVEKRKVSRVEVAYLLFAVDASSMFQHDDEKFFIYLVIYSSLFRYSIKKQADLEEEKEPDLARPIPVRASGELGQNAKRSTCRQNEA